MWFRSGAALPPAFTTGCGANSPRGAIATWRVDALSEIAQPLPPPIAAYPGGADAKASKTSVVEREHAPQCLARPKREQEGCEG
jgi:hypothetical protein